MDPAEIKKIDYARMLAACLTYFAYHQRDGVGLLTFDTDIRAHVPASRRRGQLLTILSEIDRIQPSEQTEFRKPLRFLAEYLTRRGLIVLISDLYDEPDNIIAGLKALKAKGNDIIVFHIMDNFELTFPFEDMAQFEDLETKKKLHVIPEYLRTQYLAILNDTWNAFGRNLSGARIDYCLMDTSKPLDAGLFNYLAAAVEEYADYVVSESILIVWFCSFGDTGVDSPRAPRKIRNHSVQFLDVSSEGAEAIDPPAEDEKSSADGLAFVDPCAAGRRICPAVYDAAGETGSQRQLRIAA